MIAAFRKDRLIALLARLSPAHQVEAGKWLFMQAVGSPARGSQRIGEVCPEADLRRPNAVFRIPTLRSLTPLNFR